MNTKNVQVGEETFVVRNKASYRLLNEISSLSIRISRETDSKLIADLQASITETVLKGMVVEPKIDDAYLDNADEDVYLFSIKLAQELTELLSDRIDTDLKKN